jgi:LPPG:FO 2-phospho-L-lactate transferase
VASIAPILGLPGMSAALLARSAPVVAITPVVSGRPPATPPERSRAHVRAAFMAARGLDHRAVSVAGAYRGLVDGFVLDHRDAGQQPAVEALGLRVLLADTLAPPAARPALAAAVLAFGASLRPGAPATRRGPDAPRPPGPRAAPLSAP